MFGVKVGQQSRHVDVVRRHRSDGDGAAHQLGDLVGGDVHGADGGQRGPRVGQHRFACRGQPHRATRPIHQGLAQFAFQTLDLCADRGLSDVDPLGCPGEVGLLGDGDQILQLSKFHKQ